MVRIDDRNADDPWLFLTPLTVVVDLQGKKQNTKRHKLCARQRQSPSNHQSHNLNRMQTTLIVCKHRFQALAIHFDRFKILP